METRDTSRGVSLPVGLAQSLELMERRRIPFVLVFEGRGGELEEPVLNGIMSFSSLPEELVDLIADFVGLAPEFRHVARCSLLHFSLVSRQTCTSAQRILYRRPLIYVPNHTWDRAESLLRTLERNDNRIGRLVRGTDGIDVWLYDLQVSDDSEGEGAEGVLRRKQWYLSILRACPQLRSVELLFPPKHQDLIDLFVPLSPKDPRSTTVSAPPSLLRSIALPFDFDDETSPAPEFDYTHVFKAFERSSIRSLDRLWLGDVNWLRGGPRSTSPCFPFPVQTLTIHSRSNRLADSAHLFPKDTSSLRDLTFSGAIDLNGMDLLSLSTLVGSNLESLSLSFPPSSSKPRLTTYAQPSSLPRIPTNAFSTFPHLITLGLHRTHGPSLRFLETLARKSPHLYRISFMFSRWIADVNPLSPEQDEIFPKEQILAISRQFRFLRSIHLGTLPTMDPGSYADFVGTVRGMGIRVDYGVCDQDEEED